MKATFSKIGLGALLATAFNVATAGPTATTSQTGTGNTAYAEQTLIDPTFSTSATIIQVGNNNHAGDPLAQTPGILQRNLNHSINAAEINQSGNENTASIVQDSVRFQINEAKIKQIGDNNGAAIVQTGAFSTYGLLRQEGVHNVATLEQPGGGDSGFDGSQTGSANVLRVLQNGGRGHAYVTQSGSLNSISLDQEHTLGYVVFNQAGDLNTINSVVPGEGTQTIQQTGTGNTATILANYSDIVQTGDNNLATLSQAAFGRFFNYALMAQSGNGNQASVTQASGSMASIKQVGDNFIASVNQNGRGNNAGIYQH